MIKIIKQDTQTEPSIVYFADIAVDALEVNKTLPAKFRRMLRRFKLGERIEGKRVAIKMHFGGDIGYTTIHPVFIRLLVEELQRAGATRITAMDNKVEDGLPRGYTSEVLDCEMVSTFGNTGKYLYREEIGYKGLDFAEFGGEAYDCDFFIDLAHIKGHGSCGFGGSLKNIAMGVVNQVTRGKLHRLEGGIVHDPEKCTLCKKCIEACPNNAASFVKDENTDKEEKRFVMFHDCTYCQHCVLTCPEGALSLDEHEFGDFAQGMALVTAKFLERFDPDDLLFINVLTNITMFCDCWGMSTASLVPDIGILVSKDIVAIETASLDMIKTENLLANGLPKGRELLDREGHLFEKIHGKDPYLMVKYLGEMGKGAMEYRIKEVK